MSTRRRHLLDQAIRKLAECNKVLARGLRRDAGRSTTGVSGDSGGRKDCGCPILGAKMRSLPRLDCGLSDRAQRFVCDGLPVRRLRRTSSMSAPVSGPAIVVDHSIDADRVVTSSTASP